MKAILVMLLALTPPITVFLNGVELSVHPPPRVIARHLMVPVRRIITALGLPFERHGRDVQTYAASKTITLTIGSTRAHVDDQTVGLDAPPVELRGVLYAPLRFFTEALGAQATFDRAAHRVTILSGLVGRSGNGRVGTDVMGSITAIDLNSSPATLTVTYNESVRTIPISPSAQIVVEDVDTGTVHFGDAVDLHVGDWAKVVFNRAGHAKQIVDQYGSRTGIVAAAASGQIVLGDGHVIVPESATSITLNGAPVAVGAIAVGDVVTERYNIDTFEPRQIIASRKAVGTPPPAGPVSITRLDVAPQHPLKEGDTLFVTLHGTPGGRASYDIGLYVTDQTLRENSPGVYSGSYAVRRGVNFAPAPILGHLTVRGTVAPSSESIDLVSVSTEMPGIRDHAPDADVTVSNPRPSIYVTFASGTVPVNPSSEALIVNGHDVTSESIRSARFIQYIPQIDYRNGRVNVTVRVADEAGNVASKSWTFYVQVK